MIAVNSVRCDKQQRWALKSETVCIQILALFPCCVPWGRSHNFSVPLSPPLWDVGANNVDSVMCLYIHYVYSVEHLEQGLTIVNNFHK